jgi:hypothetical protein
VLQIVLLVLLTLPHPLPTLLPLPVMRKLLPAMQSSQMAWTTKLKLPRLLLPVLHLTPKAQKAPHRLLLIKPHPLLVLPLPLPRLLKTR